MDHVKDIELIELAARRLEAEREKAVRAHLQDCPACQAKWRDIRSTWDLLGAWQVRPAAALDVARLAAAQRERPSATVLRFPGIRVIARVAALIAVSVLIGYAGGRWSIRPLPSGTGAEPSYVSVLGFESGGSFSSLVLQDGPAAREEG
ncbi:MAG: hypothetical protein MUC88_25880 [Planctomycetes bacterium]|nr:hypothetical protein [Planctomycetota bacterium]